MRRKTARWVALSLAKNGHGHIRAAESIGCSTTLLSAESENEAVDVVLSWQEPSRERLRDFSGHGCKALLLEGLTCAKLNLSTAVLVNSSTTAAKLWAGSR